MWASLTNGKFSFRKETLGFNYKHFNVHLSEDHVFPQPHYYAIIIPKILKKNS